MRINSPMKRVAAKMALPPARSIEECDSKPVMTVSKSLIPLCASTTSIIVGSPTRTASGIGRSLPSRATIGRTPVQPTSSS